MSSLQTGRPGFNSQQSWEFFSPLRSDQPSIQLVPGGAPSLGVKRPVRKADHSPPSSAEVKNTRSYTSSTAYSLMVWCLVKHRDFTFTLTFYLHHFWQCENVAWLGIPGSHCSWQSPLSFGSPLTANVIVIFTIYYQGWDPVFS